MTKRFFGDWDMRLAHRARGAKIDATLAAVKSPHEILKRLRIEQSVLARSAWGQLFAEWIIPRLQADSGPGSAVTSTTNPISESVDRRDRDGQEAPAIWHAGRGAAAKLATLVLAVDPGAVTSYLNAMLAQGATLEALFSEVFEPAARHLGRLWDEDRCQEIEMTGASAVCKSFECSGWDVSCAFPDSDGALCDLVHDRWFDVLDLTLSAAMRRGHRLQSVGETIVAARASSLNPALVVIVGGRAFYERPKAHLDMHAHAGCVTVTEAVPAAQQLTDAVAAGNAHEIRQWQTDPSLGNSRSSQSTAASLRIFEKRFRSTVFSPDYMR